LSTGSTAHESRRKTQHIVLATETQFAAVVMVWKLSGYAQSVKGHGKQQVRSALSF
jgi:hypothetical protein